MNEDCFLEKPEWKSTILSISSPEDCERHPIVISLWIIQIACPRLLRQTGEYIYAQKHDPGLKSAITRDLFQTRDELFDWRSRWEQLAAEPDAFAKPYKLRELLGMYITSQTFIHRSIIALNVLRPDSHSYETFVQDLANTHSALVKDAMTHQKGRRDLLFARTSHVARVTLATGEEWLEATSWANRSQADKQEAKIDSSLSVTRSVDWKRGVISAELWEHWNCLMGRNITAKGTMWERVRNEIRGTDTWLNVATREHGYLDEKVKRI
jgi:hypothetical protein